MDGTAQMHMNQGALTPVSLSDMGSQIGVGLDDIFCGSFGRGQQ